tara:strand:+ start:1039 stop:1737 length:699 start_codon:yes stop_codon:yes gene_type:complete
MRSFIFDVDGTLTPSRGRINKHFAVWFKNFATHNPCYIVTGSDKSKTLEQLGSDIYDLAVKSYQCSGNDVYEGSQNIYTSNVNWDSHMTGFFQQELNSSAYLFRTGIHVEYRPGLINFSIIGRRASKAQRNNYISWDNQEKERVGVVERFNAKFPKYQASVAGEIGIDIVVRGNDKSQIIKDFYDKGDIYFFGDNCTPGGNDYEIAVAVEGISGCVHHVKDWKDTWERLKNL